MSALLNNMKYILINIFRHFYPELKPHQAA